MFRKLKRIAVASVLVIAALAVVIAVSLRFFVSHDTSRWHVDPLTAQGVRETNSDLSLPPESPQFAVTPLELQTAVGEVMATLPRTHLLATSEQGGLRTWVSKSSIMAFPDYTSIRVLPVEGDPNTSTVAIFARARYGLNDLGVNRDRNSEILRGLLERVGSVG